MSHAAALTFGCAPPVRTRTRSSWSPARTRRRPAVLPFLAPALACRLRSRQARLSPACNLERPPRAQSGWGASLLSLPRSRVLTNVWPQLVTSFAVSSSVVVAHSVAMSFVEIPPLSTTPHQFLASALSLVIVFRTNAACTFLRESRHRLCVTRLEKSTEYVTVRWLTHASICVCIVLYLASVTEPEEQTIYSGRGERCGVR
jgi:Bestrophin, RFP-TM, chloride channel